MSWFVPNGKPRWLRIVALLLAGYVAYVMLPTIFSRSTSPFQRVIALTVAGFFTYLFCRSAVSWEEISASVSRKK